jgi:hypothetical protein
MGTRIAVWLDDDLEERLDALLAEMENSPSLRDMGITKSAVIKAAIRRGLPFMELDHGISRLTLPLLTGFIDSTLVELLERAEQLDLDLPHYKERKPK